MDDGSLGEAPAETSVSGTAPTSAEAEYNWQRGGTWTCSSCNFSNDPSHLQCIVCRCPGGVCEDSSWGGSHIPFEEPVQSRRPSGISSFVSALLPDLVPENQNQSLVGTAITASTVAVTATVAVVGASMGAVAGAMAGRATDSGVLRGLGLGAIAGAVVTVEAIDATRSFLRQTRDSGNFNSFAGMVQSLGTFLDERWSSTQNLEQQLGNRRTGEGEWQLDLDSMSYDEMYDLFGGRPAAPGVPAEAIATMEKKELEPEDLEQLEADAVCAICLNGYAHGECMRVLPGCSHKFHQVCVDRWLHDVGRCPVCRNEVPFPGSDEFHKSRAINRGHSRRPLEPMQRHPISTPTAGSSRN